jgi:indole-3-glycerol phosphate synthase
MTVPSILREIADSTRRRIEVRRRLRLPERPADIGPPRRGRFREALQRPSSGVPVRFLCELKKASPSRGLLRSHFEPDAIARDYAAHGAHALSVLTEPEYFDGRHEYLTEARTASHRPCLMKDFVLDPFQLEEAAHYGADAVLLILAMLGDSDFLGLLEYAGGIQLDVLVEVHSEEELGRALAANAELVGINNRNLETFEVDPGVTERLFPLVSQEVTLVSESGVSGVEDIRRLSDLGVDAVLIGEHFMSAEHPGEALDELRRAADAAVRDST